MLFHIYASWFILIDIIALSVYMMSIDTSYQQILMNYLTTDFISIASIYDLRMNINIVKFRSIQVFISSIRSILMRYSALSIIFPKIVTEVDVLLSSIRLHNVKLSHHPKEFNFNFSHENIDDSDDFVMTLINSRFSWSSLRSSEWVVVSIMKYINRLIGLEIEASFSFNLRKKIYEMMNVKIVEIRLFLYFSVC